MARAILPSFAKGELSPELHGRVDTAAYAIGLATARNAIIHTYGGLSKRPGTQFIGPVADHTYAPRLIPFQFKTADQYIIEVGDLYMRFIRDNGYVTTNEHTITDITQADPAVVTTDVAHGYSNGDEVFISGVSGMTEVNGNRYYIANVTSDTFELTDQVTGADIDSTSFTAYSANGTVEVIYEITSPFAIADVPNIKYTQSADVMTLTHPSYTTRELSRTAHDNWTISKIAIGTNVDTPADQTVTVNTTGTETDRYRVTAIDRETDEESLPGLNDTEATITDITQADPGVVTANSHGFADGDEVQLDNVAGMTEVNARRYIVANKTANTFELNDEDGNNVDTTGFTSYDSGGIARQTFVEVTNNAVTKDADISWTAVSGAGRYAVYRRDNGIYGFLGETELTTFTDDNISADTTITHPRARNPFDASGDEPGAVGFYEQRRVFGGSTNNPDTSEYSQIGRFSNFNRSTPQQNDDAISATLTSEQVNEIRHFVGLNDLLIFTSGSEWRINSGPDNTFSPDTIRQRPQSRWGCSHLKPIVMGNTVLFVTDGDDNVRSFAYSFQLDGFTGANLNVLSNHLLKGFTLDDWCATRNPESRLYLIRSDGELLTMSFDQEQEVVAWTHWDTDGDFEKCASLRNQGDNNEDLVYIVVNRTINGNSVRYVEFLGQRQFDDIRDYFMVDSGLSHDNPVAISGVTAADPIVVTTSTAHGFSDGDEVDISDIVWVPDEDELGNKTQPTQINGGRFKVANKTSNTFELTNLDDEDIDGTSNNAYVSGGNVRKAFSTFAGADHLEGETVVALADGNVVKNLTVSGGQVTFSRKFSRVHIGLPYITDVEPLNFESGQGTIQGLPVKVSKLTLRFFKSRGMFYGPDEDQLFEIKQRELETLGEPTALLTGDKHVNMTPQWQTNGGRIFLRHSDPLPMTLLAIIPDIITGDN